MKKHINIILAALCIAGCAKTPEVKVNASFETNKDSYSLLEDVIITNTTTVENSVPAIYKWEWAENVSYSEVPQGISFDKEGEFTITLTVTANDGAVKGTCSKTITVIDNNQKPVADFEWSPEAVKAGEEVTFTDKSYDPDGSIVAWSWTLGSSSSKVQNPVHAFVEYGEVSVTLTVTDNAKATASVTKTITVEKGKFSLELKWFSVFGTTEGASTRFTSPALNADGSHIYVTSGDAEMLCYNPQGTKLWSYDYGEKGVEFDSKDGGAAPVACPSVDSDGVVYMAAGFDNNGDNDGTNGLFAINPDGTLKWFANDGTQTRFGYHSPVIMGDWVMTTQRFGARNSSGSTDKSLFSSDQGCAVASRADGSRVTTIYTSQGSWGGIAGWGDNLYINVAGNTTHLGGCQMGFGDGNGAWTLVNNSSGYSQETLWPGYGYRAMGCQLAISKDNRLYFLSGDAINSSNGMGVLICYDLNSLTSTMSSAPTPLWKTSLKGVICSALNSTSDPAALYGNGVALSESGMVFATTNDAVFGLSKEGSEVWCIKPSGTVQCVPAVDKDGFVYFTTSAGSLVKVLGTTGERVAAIDLGCTICSSPVIGPDGTIYVLGSKEGLATLFCVETNDMKGPADNWSQLSGNPSHTSYMPAN